MDALSTNLMDKDLPDELRDKYVEMHRVMESIRRATMLQYYDIGVSLESAEEAEIQYEEYNCVIHRANLVHQFVKAEGLDRNFTRICMDIVRVYTRAEYEQLVDLKLKFFHIVALVGVSDPAVRRELEQKTARDGWSSKELLEEIHRRQGCPITVKSAKPRRRRAVKSTLRQLTGRARRLFDRLRECSCAEVDFASELMLPPDMVSDEIRQLVRDLITGLEDVARAVEASLGVLRARQEYYVRVLAHRAEQTEDSVSSMQERGGAVHKAQ